jgi:hypothetical protein
LRTTDKSLLDTHEDKNHKIYSVWYERQGAIYLDAVGGKTVAISDDYKL